MEFSYVAQVITDDRKFGVAGTVSDVRSEREAQDHVLSVVSKSTRIPRRFLALRLWSAIEVAS